VQTALISAFPQPRLQYAAWAIGAGKRRLGDYTALCDSGRSAAFYALRSCNVPLGTTIWMPSFQCLVVVDAAVRAGYDVDFYRIAPDLSCDLDDLDRKLRDRPGPVMVIHYYGFPQPAIAELATLCESKGVLLIEDCAHALFSSDARRPLGGYAPLAIFSLRKTLALLEGGAYRWNRTDWVDEDKSVRVKQAEPFSAAPYWLDARFIVREVIGPQITGAYRWLCRRPRKNPQQDPDDKASPQPLYVYRPSMSPLSYRLAAGCSPEEIVRIRRANWRGLDERLSRLAGYNKVFTLLDEGVCPLVMPVWVSDRPAMIRDLLAQQIEPYAFAAWLHPLVPPGAFPDTTRLCASILGLPVHQHLTQFDLDHIADAFTRSLERCPGRSASS